MLLVAAVLALLIGLSLGLLGGGGSILTLPVLVYVLGVEAKSAITTSLFVVGCTSGIALVAHARAHRVRWRVGSFFGGAGMAGAYLGGLAGRLVPASLLLVGFAAVMLAASMAMLRRRDSVEHVPPVHFPAVKVLLVGALVGVVAGLLGAGGGFLIVPALVMLTGLPMAEAVGTSLLVITMQSAAGFVGNVGHVSIDWHIAIGVTIAAIIGSVFGARLAGRVSAKVLRRAFAWFVLVLGVLLLIEQMPPTLRAWLVSHPMGWGVVAALGLLLMTTALRIQRAAEASITQ